MILIWRYRKVSKMLFDRSSTTQNEVWQKFKKEHLPIIKWGWKNKKEVWRILTDKDGWRKKVSKTKK